MAKAQRGKVKVRLDWRFEINLRLVRISLEEVRQFHAETNLHFRRRFKELDRDYKQYTKAQLHENRGIGDTLEDHFVDLYQEVKGLQAFSDELLVARLFGILEIFLRKVFDHFEDEGVIVRSEREKRGRAYLKTFKKGFSQAGVVLTALPFAWVRILELQTIRNCIAHSGWVDMPSAKRLSRLKTKADTMLELPDHYFDEAWTLVDETCKQVSAAFMAKYGKAKSW